MGNKVYIEAGREEVCHGGREHIRWHYHLVSRGGWRRYHLVSRGGWHHYNLVSGEGGITIT